MTGSVKKMIRKFGLPRIIIVLFFLFLVVCAGAFQMNLPQFSVMCSAAGECTVF